MQHAVKRIFAIAAVIITLALMAVPGAMSQSGSIIANASVACPFSIHVNTQAAYLFGSNAAGNYTIRTIAACSISDMNGSLVVTNQSGSIVFSEGIVSGPVGNTPSSVRFTIPSNSFNNGTYTASINFTYINTKNESSSQFKIIRQANITLQSFSVSQSTLSVGSPVSFTSQLKNTGQLASGNVIFYINITGPAKFSFSYPINALSPGQNQTLTVLFSNITSQAGAYTASAYAKFEVNSTNKTSSEKNLTYEVSSQQSSAPAHRQSVVSIPGIVLSSVPLYTTMAAGQSSLDELGVTSTASVPEYVNLSVPSQYSEMVNLSAKSVYLYQGEGLDVGVLYRSAANALPGRYVIPINITVSAVDGVAESQTEYLTIVVYQSNATKPSISMQVNLYNNSRSASGIISIKAPGIQPSNYTIVSLIPIGVAGNVSYIRAYGLPNHVTASAGSYVLKWYESPSYENTTAYAYYSIENLSNQQALLSQQVIFIQQSQPQPRSIMKVLDINIPDLYENSTSNITVEVLYTGTAPQPVLVSIAPPPGISMPVSSQYVNASPNQIITTSFRVTSHTTGTQLIGIYVSTYGAELNYSVPAVTLPTPIKPATTTVPQVSYGSILISVYGMLFLILILFIALVLAVIMPIIRRRGR